MPSRVTRFHRYQCEWEPCNKSFQRKSDMQRHYRIHTNERPFTCQYGSCKKSFIQRSALTVHLRTHTGEKPHQCKYPGCEKRFSDSSSLARHRRIHTGKRPHECAHESCTRRHRRRNPHLILTSRPHSETSSESGLELPTTPLPSSIDPYSPVSYHSETSQRYLSAYDDSAKTPYYLPSTPSGADNMVVRGITTLDLSSIPQFVGVPSGAVTPISPAAFSPAPTVPSQSGYFDSAQPSPVLESHSLIQFPSVPSQLYPTSDVRGHFAQPPQWNGNELSFQNQQQQQPQQQPQRVCVPVVAAQVPTLYGYNYWDLEHDDNGSLVMNVPTGPRFGNAECSPVVF